MSGFKELKELFSMLSREQKILTELFDKRKRSGLKYDYVMDNMENNEERLNYLVNHEVLRENGNVYELDDIYVQFFEHVSEANEEINVSYINENLEKIKNNIGYYIDARSDSDRYNYLRKIKTTLRGIGTSTLRNVVDLKRNIDDTYKNEANYKNKKAKLQNFDKKSNDITHLIGQTEELLTKEVAFFTSATDDELNNIILELKIQLDKCSHNLIEIQRQIMNYLNKVEAQNSLLEKIRKIKYHRDQITLLSSTNIEKVLQGRNAVVFEPNPMYPLKLSLDLLQSDESAFESIKKVAKLIKNKVKTSQLLADDIADEYLQTQTEEEIFINIEEMKNGFMASSYTLLDFVMNYQYPKPVSFDEKVTIFCQIVSQYENLLDISDKYQTKEGIEFAIVSPKKQ